jgi:hypothetical protein
MLTRSEFAALLLGVPAALGVGTNAAAGDPLTDPLPSWNEGASKAAILGFVRAATDATGPNFVHEDDRIATFDQDGTLWVEHPVYTEVIFSFDRVVALAPQHAEWKTEDPFKSILAGDRSAIAAFSIKDLETIVAATHTGITTEDFRRIAAAWIAKAKDPRWNRPYTELVYKPMLEVMRYLRTNEFKTYIVTGGGQNFVRAYAQPVYGIPTEQVIGSASKTSFTHGKDGRAILMQEPTLLLNNNMSGKAEDINLFLGRRPHAAFGNSSGDREMLEFTQGNNAARLMMLVLHDDAEREFAYGPAQGLPDTKIGTFPQSLYDEATGKGWSVISMKADWKTMFP